MVWLKTIQERAEAHWSPMVGRVITGASALGEQTQSALIAVLVPVAAATKAHLATACHQSKCPMQDSGKEEQAKFGQEIGMRDGP